MTNEIEKEFFDTFGINPKPNESGYGRCLKYDNLLKCDSEKKDLMEGCPGCEYFEVFKFYPTITNHILLEIIEIIIKFDFGIRIDYDADGYGIASENYSGHFEENLKDSVLDFLITNKTLFYHQVRALFGEKEEK